MICPNCNRSAAANDDFCAMCGSSMEQAQAASQQDVKPPPGPSLLAVSWRGGQVALAILLVGVAFLLISALTLLLQPLPNGLAWGAWLGSHSIGLVIIAAVWSLMSDKSRPLAALGLVRIRVSWTYCGLLIALALGASIGATALYAWAISPLEVEWLLPPEVPQEVAFSGIAVLLTFEALAGWTPLTEEIFFRGFVFAGLVPRWGILKAGVGSALIFALFHLYPGVLVPIFFTGLLLAGLYYLTGSLWPAVLVHVGQNALALLAIIYKV